MLCHQKNPVHKWVLLPEPAPERTSIHTPLPFSSAFLRCMKCCLNAYTTSLLDMKRKSTKMYRMIRHTKQKVTTENRAAVVLNPVQDFSTLVPKLIALRVTLNTPKRNRSGA